MPIASADVLARAPPAKRPGDTARRELGYQPSPLNQTLHATLEWYGELIEAGAFTDSHGSGLSRIADSMRLASRFGLVTPMRIGQRITGRRLIAGG